MTLLLSWLSKLLEMTLLTLRLTGCSFLVHLVNHLLTATPWDIWITSIIMLCIFWIHVWAKPWEWILAVQGRSPASFWGWVQNINLTSTCGSKQSFFILPHTHCNTLSSTSHVVLYPYTNSKINILLALSDCVSHVRSSTKINVPFIHFSSHWPMWMLLLNLQTCRALSGLV